MASDKLKEVPEVEIDPCGTFKYILIKVYAAQTPDGCEPSKMIVRGNKRGPYHGKSFHFHMFLLYNKIFNCIIDLFVYVMSWFYLSFL